MRDVIYVKPDNVKSFNQQINETFFQEIHFCHFFQEIPVFKNVKSKVIISFFEPVRLSFFPRNLYNLFESIKARVVFPEIVPINRKINLVIYVHAKTEGHLP